ncbi:hypothetical protein L6164_017286 [Bauhinia variegata]|uniref:Uncharacterized protein n=1 Tax=Bauhinia variegata TaxID=167791 RepID=A0ACB9NAZ2_BAUVA|nr:hypothetical protein L6164_017286 [Bauhinia variegata]
MVTFVTSTIHGGHHRPHGYGIRPHTTAGQVFDVLNGLGTIAFAFAFAGHSVVLEIQATIPSTEEKPSKKPMWRGVIAAYLIVIACYITVAVSGYWAFGANVEDDVLISLEHPSLLIAVSNFMVFFHVLGSYQVFAMPVFDMIESCLVQKWNFSPSITLRIVCRSVFVACAGFVSICVPFFGGLLGFFWWISICVDIIFYSSYNMVGTSTIKKFEPSLDCINDLHNSWHYDSNSCTYWRNTNDYYFCEDLQDVFLIMCT